MDKIYAIVLSIFLLAGASLGRDLTAQEVNISGLKLISEFEGGKLYKADNLLVLQLQGSYREMGRQEGYLLRDQLSGLFALAVEGYFLKNHTRQDLLYMTKHDFELYPRRFQEILYGMAETSGMEMDRLILLNQMIRLDKLESFVQPPSHCSAIAAWGNYTADGRLIFGRNFDWREHYKDYAEFAAVTVYNPTDGSNPAASVGYIGSLEMLSGMNNQGLFIELNDGSISAGGVRRSDRMPYTDLTGFLFDINNLDQLGAAISSTNTFWPSIVNVADGNRSCSYEWATYAVKQRAPDRDGLLVATNHFVDPSWEIAGPVGDPSQTVTRRSNLLALGERYRGQITVQKMMDILDTPLEKGGATRPITVIQIIAVPENRTLWVQTPGYQSWAKVDLSRLFQAGSSDAAMPMQTGSSSKGLAAAA